MCNTVINLNTINKLYYITELNRNSQILQEIADKYLTIFSKTAICRNLAKSSKILLSFLMLL